MQLESRLQKSRRDFGTTSSRKGQEYADSINLNRLRNHRRSIDPGYGHRNPGGAGMEDLPEGEVSDSDYEIEEINCVWREELAEGYLGKRAEGWLFLCADWEN